jgi:hypothetical protein
MNVDNPAINEFINNLLPGQVIDLQLGRSTIVRMKPSIIGIDLGNYILIKFPIKLNPSDYKDVLVAGTSAIVRYILEGERGECVAFSTTIQQVLMLPNRMILLNYPKRIENRQLRTSQREKTHLPAQISQNKTGNKLAGNCINGYIVDISANGCQFSFRPEEGKGGLKECPVFIAISIVGSNEPLIIKAHVKNNRRDNTNILVGIMFDDISLQDIAGLLVDMSIGIENSVV